MRYEALIHEIAEAVVSTTAECGYSSSNPVLQKNDSKPFLKICDTAYGYKEPQKTQEDDLPLRSMTYETMPINNQSIF